jgi:type II secretory pathway component GspD/PulD (secretin)
MVLPGAAGCVAGARSDDTRYEEVLEVVALEHATAAEVAHTLAGLGAQSGRSDGRWRPVSIAVDQRTNSLVLRGQRLRVMELRRVIAELDRAT